MVKSRVHNLLLFVTGLFFCCAAVSVTYVSNAQTQKGVGNEPVSERSAVDPARSQVEPEIHKSEGESDTPETASTAIQVPETHPTSRSVTIAGRALDEGDRGRPNVLVTLREANGTSHSATSDKRGNFRFENVAVGQQVVLSAGDQPDPDLDVTLSIKGETRVFWRTPGHQTKNGKR